MGNRHDARQFVNSFFAGNATEAILTIASACGVAVAYQDRMTFESRLGRPISDEEFEGIIAACGFDGYDEVVDNAFEYSDVVSDWMNKVLADAGLTEDGDDPAVASGDEFKCQKCEKPAFLTGTGIAQHLNAETEGIDYDADADHVPFTLSN